MRDSRHEPAALPELAVVAIHHLLRDLDRFKVILGVKPLAGRDLIDPVEAIKPVVRHASNPIQLLANRPFSTGENDHFEIWFHERFSGFRRPID